MRKSDRQRAGIFVLLLGCLTSLWLVGFLLLPLGFRLLRPDRA